MTEVEVNRIPGRTADIDSGLFQIINTEMGRSSADLFARFYQGTLEEQVAGAKDLLTVVTGPSRAEDLLKNYLTTTKKS